MPSKKQPKTLQQLCILTVTWKFELVTYGFRTKEQSRIALDSGSFLEKPIFPYTDFPSCILEELLEAITQHRTLNRFALHPLIQPQLQRLSLASSPGDIFFALSFLRERCYQLRALNLDYVTELCPNWLISFIPQLQNVTVLSLKMTITTDRAMSDIGQYCTNLRELDVTATGVTDQGLVRLCFSPDGERQGFSLRCLRARRNLIGGTGILCCFKNLENLVDFEFDRQFEAMQLLTTVGDIPGWEHCADLVLKIQKILASEEVNSSECLEATARFCPDLRHISFVAGNDLQGPESLEALTRFENLQVLEIANSEYMSLDFWDSILPLLEIIGTRLTKLSLTRMQAVELCSIGVTCPNLTSLRLVDCFQFIPIEITVPSLFQRLEEVEITLYHANVPSGSNVIRQVLLYSKQIKKIVFGRCSALEKVMLAEILKVNPMPLLEEIQVDQCSELCSIIFLHLLDSKNLLSTLRIWSCPKISKTDSDVILQKIKRQNLDVHLEWYPCRGYE